MVSRRRPLLSALRAGQRVWRPTPGASSGWGTIYKLDPKDGHPVAKIQTTKEDPEIHGLDLHDGVRGKGEDTSGSFELRTSPAIGCR